MKRDRSKQHLTRTEYEKFKMYDTRYYGLFYKKGDGKTTVKIDPKRFAIATGYEFPPEQHQVMNKRKTHYFYPRTEKYYEYACNRFVDAIQYLREYWENHEKDLIRYALSRLERPTPRTIGDSGLFMQGILEFDEAGTWSNMEDYRSEIKYQREANALVKNLYAQFIHQMASQIEAVTVQVLTEKNAMEEHFTRNVLYGTAAGKERKVTSLPSFRYYDELYCLWNFIKHNSQSTYDKIRGGYPELVIKDEYHQGELASLFINFSNELIGDLLDGCTAFFKEYCALVFDENYEEAQWNFGEYFREIVWETKNAAINPMDIPWYL